MHSRGIKAVHVPYEPQLKPGEQETNVEDAIRRDKKRIVLKHSRVSILRLQGTSDSPLI